MRFRKPILLGAALLAVMAFGAAAQAPYVPYVQSYPYNPAPNTPPAWSYNPYTSGLGPCVQANRGNSPQCRETLVPTAGQPNYSVPR